MSTSTSLLAFTDCLAAYDRALADPLGTRVLMDDEGAAIYFRMRCHQARKLVRQNNAKIYPDPEHPLHGRSVYDGVTCRVRWVDDRVYCYFEQIIEIDEDRIENLSEVEDTPQLTHRPALQLEFHKEDEAAPAVPVFGLRKP